jgi:hypothetical protein
LRGLSLYADFHCRPASAPGFRIKKAHYGQWHTRFGEGMEERYGRGGEKRRGLAALAHVHASVPSNYNTARAKGEEGKEREKQEEEKKRGGGGYTWRHLLCKFPPVHRLLLMGHTMLPRPSITNISFLFCTNCLVLIADFFCTFRT